MTERHTAGRAVKQFTFILFIKKQINMKEGRKDSERNDKREIQERREGKKLVKIKEGGQKNKKMEKEVKID